MPSGIVALVTLVGMGGVDFIGEAFKFLENSGDAGSPESFQCRERLFSNPNVVEGLHSVCSMVRCLLRIAVSFYETSPWPRSGCCTRQVENFLVAGALLGEHFSQIKTRNWCRCKTSRAANVGQRLDELGAV